MSGSILDQLEFVQTTQDVPNNFIENVNRSQPCNNFDNFDELKQSNDLKASYNSKPSRIMMGSWTNKSKSVATGISIPSYSQIQLGNSGELISRNSLFHNCRQLNENDCFNCKSCMNDNSYNCTVCKGKKQLKGTDKIIKFFQYILEFKLGTKQTYNPQKKIIKKNVPNEHCNIYFSNIADNYRETMINQDEGRLSMSVNPNRIVSKIQHQQKMKNIKETHYGYNCDHCDMDPIVGARYHCCECQNYDLCQDCYQRAGHYHQMNRIQLKNNQKTLQRVTNILQNGSSVRASIKNSCYPLRNSCTSKIYKSSIR